jgi:polysaccharide biosynthesis transport protein
MATADESLPPDAADPAARRSRALVERRETALSTQVMQDWMSDEEDDDSINLRAYWAVVMRRKWTVLTFFAIVVVAVMTATYLTTPSTAPAPCCRSIPRTSRSCNTSR